jgi:hypothetical protein
MPKSTEQYYNRALNRYETREVGTDDDIVSKAKSQDASGLGGRVKASPFVPPKMEPNEDSSKYSSRVAKAREAWNQRKAMTK